MRACVGLYSRIRETKTTIAALPKVRQFPGSFHEETRTVVVQEVRPRMETQMKKATTKPMLTVTFNWSGNIPKKIKKQWEAMFQPKSITISIPPTKESK